MSFRTQWTGGFARARAFVAPQLVCALVLAACTRESGVPTPDGETFASIPSGPCAGKLPSTPRRIRRLTNKEYTHVLTDLFGQSMDHLEALLVSDSGLADDADALLVSESQFENYLIVAERVAQAANVARLAPCESGEESQICVTRFVRAFGRRAYGRAVTADEETRLLTVFKTVAQTEAYEGGIQAVMQVILQSPGFLYRTEMGAHSRGKVVRLTQEELASELSFLVTGSRPDEELLAAAERGELADGGQLRKQVLRLMKDPRARDQLRHLIIAWFGLDDLGEVVKDTHVVMADDYNERVRAAMMRELDDFIDHILWDGSATFQELMTSSRSAVPPELAPLYGADLLEPAGAWVEREPAHRKGLLSLPAFFTRYSKPDLSSPVMRGVFVRRRLLCQDLPDPPATALAQVVDATATGTTTRAKFSQHTSGETCRTCHMLIDPVGFGLEDMDAIGRFRTMEGMYPVDSSGALSGTDVDGPFEGPAQLGEKLGDSAIARRCFATQIFRLTEGRLDDDGDQCVLRALGDVTVRPETKLQDVIATLIVQQSFGFRRVEP